MAAPLSSWQPTAERLARRLRVGVPFRVVESAVVDAPILIGWLQPLVVLPLAAMAHMTAAQVEALVAHELAHIRRRDYAINLLQTIAEALLFFHPGVWWVSRRIRQEREHCCDDAAIAVAGEATAYAEALMALASWREREFQPSLGAAKGSLLLRIRRLLSVAPDGRAAGSRRTGRARNRRRPRRDGDGAVGRFVGDRTGARADERREPPRPPDRSLRDLLPAVARPARRSHRGTRRSAPTNASASICATTSRFKVPLILFESAADLQRSRGVGRGGCPAERRRS